MIKALENFTYYLEGKPIQIYSGSLVSLPEGDEAFLISEGRAEDAGDIGGGGSSSGGVKFLTIDDTYAYLKDGDNYVSYTDVMNFIESGIVLYVANEERQSIASFFSSRGGEGYNFAQFGDAMFVPSSRTEWEELDPKDRPLWISD